MKKNKIKKYTVSIGIPAYNEESNITYLLSDLLRQKGRGFSIKEIIVSSDGSQDKTVEKVSSFQNKIVSVIDNYRRSGIAARLNQLVKLSTSDILVILNADISIQDSLFIEKLINPIVQKRADLTSCPIQELPAQNFFEHILAVSMKIKHRIFKHIRQGNNVFTCHGPARAFSKKIYKKIHFPSSIGEDAYSYLFCIYYGYTYEYVTKAHVLYKLPTNLLDHQKQSERFFYSKIQMEKLFGEKFVKTQYHIPFTYIIESFIYFAIKNPIKIFSYLLILVFLKIKPISLSTMKEEWDISNSSKVLRA